eukprot:6193613-Pleurochrysis_carterae.AAC.2
MMWEVRKWMHYATCSRIRNDPCARARVNESASVRHAAHIVDTAAAHRAHVHKGQSEKIEGVSLACTDVHMTPLLRAHAYCYELKDTPLEMLSRRVVDRAA